MYSVLLWKDGMIEIGLIGFGLAGKFFHAQVILAIPGLRLAAILQRGTAIASAGGYLRELTRKAEAGEFTIGPMLMALISTRNREKKRA